MCLVADVHPDGRLTIVADEERFARLGEGVDESGRLSDAAMNRVLARTAECKSTAECFKAELILIGATSASRDAANVAQLIERVRNELGLDYRVISGDEEAALSFRGALAMAPGFTEACVLDIGGGSTEFIAGQVGEIRYRVSLNMGSMRLKERFFQHQPPSAVRIQRAVADVYVALGGIPADVFAGLSLIECGGTAHVLANLVGSDSPAPRIERQVVRDWRDRLLAMSPEEVRELNPGVLTGREDVTGAALLILDTVMDRFGFDAFIAGQGGLRHGIALSAADDP